MIMCRPTTRYIPPYFSYLFNIVPLLSYSIEKWAKQKAIEEIEADEAELAAAEE